MPTNRPMSRASAKSVSDRPPSTVSAPRMKKAPRPVLIVRGAVAMIASFATCASGRLRCSDQVSRTRSIVTTESFTDTPMIVSAAARKTPSIGLPSQAKMPTTMHDVVEHREHRAGRHRPAEAERQVGQLREQRDDEGDERLVAQLVAQRRADQLVAGDARPRRPGSASAVRISSHLLLGDVGGAHGDVLAGLLHDRGREAGLLDGRPGVGHRQLLAGRELHDPAAGELDAEVEAAHQHAEHGERRGPPR